MEKCPSALAYDNHPLVRCARVYRGKTVSCADLERTDLVKKWAKCMCVRDGPQRISQGFLLLVLGLMQAVGAQGFKGPKPDGLIGKSRPSLPK